MPHIIAEQARVLCDLMCSRCTGISMIQHTVLQPCLSYSLCKFLGSILRSEAETGMHRYLRESIQEGLAAQETWGTKDMPWPSGASLMLSSRYLCMPFSASSLQLGVW